MALTPGGKPVLTHGGGRDDDAPPAATARGGASPAPSHVMYDLVDSESKGGRGSPDVLSSDPHAVQEWRKAFTRDPEFAFKEALWSLFPNGLSNAELQSHNRLWNLLMDRHKSRAFHR